MGLGGFAEGLGSISAGLGIASAFSGGKSPTNVIPFSKQGKAIYNQIYNLTLKQYDEGLMPANLLSIYIGRMKRESQSKLKSDRLLSRGSGLKGYLGGIGGNIEGMVSPERFRQDLRSDEFQNSLTNLANIRNIEMGQSVFNAQTAFQRSALAQMRAIRQGQAIGNAFAIAGTMASGGMGGMG